MSCPPASTCTVSLMPATDSVTLMGTVTALRTFTSCAAGANPGWETWMIRIEWNIRKPKCSYRICQRYLLESGDRISDLHHGTHNDRTGRVNNRAFNRAACHRLREQSDGMERSGYAACCHQEQKENAMKHGSPHKFSLS